MKHSPETPSERVVAVINTRSSEQASELSQPLVDLGLRIIELPGIRVVPVLTVEMLQRLIVGMNEQNWLFFSSQNCVKIVHDLLQSNIDPSTSALIASLRKAAVGDRTADAIQRAGFRVDFVPTEANSDSLATEFVQQRELRSAKRSKVLLLGADVSDPHPAEILRAAGFDVAEAVAYRVVAPEPDTAAVTEIVTLLAESSYPLFVFTSSEAARNVVSMLCDDRPEIRDKLFRCPCVVIGPKTAEVVRGLGFYRCESSSTASISSVVEWIIRFNSRGHQTFEWVVE